jgi:selenocysteine lyase/cysteine desulfurase
MQNHLIQVQAAQQFPSLESMLYANHAAISPWPLPVSAAVESHASEMSQSGPLRAATWLKREIQIRERVAEMLNAPSFDDIALLKNTTEGICMVANGIDWRKGDNLVTPAGEFPSNRIAWDVLGEQGVEIRRIEIEGSARPEMDLLDAMDGRTRVLTLSSVRWDTGLRLRLDILGSACRSGNALLFVDAIQQLGALPLDVQECGIDVLSAGTHKWLMGPEGLAVFYCSEQARQTLRLSQHGWRMMDDPYRYEPPVRPPSASARRFETGTPNTLGQAAFHASLAFQQSIGHAEIARNVLENTSCLRKALERRNGIRLLGGSEPDQHSGIVSFIPADRNPQQLRRELSRRKVYVAVRGNGLRLSPHFYQSGPAMDRLIGHLEEILD